MSDYKEFVKRMGSFDMELSLEDIGEEAGQNEDKPLKHYGIKGMKWGVRRPKGTNGRVVKKPNALKRAGERVKDEYKSMQREAKWSKEPVTTYDETVLKSKLERISAENKLKSYGTRKEYIRRANVSDEDLKKRVSRLELEHRFKTEVNKATKGQLELGKAVQSALLNDMSYGLVGESASTQAVKLVRKEFKSKTGIKLNV